MDPRPGTLIRYADVAAVPWRNGGGRTRELHAGDGWWLSVATISTAGKFSSFPGRERTLVAGRGLLDLTVAGRRERLAVGDRVNFAGEAAAAATPVGGPVLAVNVMTHRRRRAASVRVIRLDGRSPAADALVLLAGAATSHGEELTTFDAVLGAGSGAVSGAGALAVVVSIEQEGQS